MLVLLEVGCGVHWACVAGHARPLPRRVGHHCQLTGAAAATASAAPFAPFLPYGPSPRLVWVLFTPAAAA